MPTDTPLKVLRRDQLGDRICVVVGTRPSLVKQSPVLRELQRRGSPFFMVHTGQHYSFELDKVFFDELELPVPSHHLDSVRDLTMHGEQTAEMLRGIERVLVEERPGI